MWFHVIRNPEFPPEVELEKISWGNVSRANYIVMLHVFPGRDVPEWVNFQDKFEKRVHVLNITTLRIDNLTLEDSGRYRARESYRRGRQYDQDFRLRVYGMWRPRPRPTADLLPRPWECPGALLAGFLPDPSLQTGSSPLKLDVMCPSQMQAELRLTPGISHFGASAEWGGNGDFAITLTVPTGLRLLSVTIRCPVLL